MTLWNVERLGSFSAVARETGWSQPAISQQIRKIERELDAKLVQRTSHGVELTPIGRILARHGQLIDNRVTQAVKDVEEYQRNGSTHIRLVAPPSVCSSFVARVLVHISKTSDIRVSLMQMEPPEAMEALEQGLADCAIIFQYNSLPALAGPDDLEVAPFGVDNRIPVIAGTGSNDTKYAIELSQEAQELGADGLLIVTPYYNKTTQRGLVAHYNAIADSVNLPIILYNVPSRTGVGFDVNTVAALAEHKNIAAIKEASGNIGYTAKVAAKCGDKIDIYSGNDDMIVPIMSLGGKGVISVLSNVLPKETHQMTQYCLENNFAAAAEMQLKYLRLINDLFMEVNPIPVKDAMNQLGMPSGPCRMPLLDMSDEHKAAMQATLRAYGMIS